MPPFRRATEPITATACRERQPYRKQPKGALQKGGGHHGDDMTKFTEEYQENMYRHQLAMLKRIPFLRGTAPWILMDFRSPRRPLAGIQDFYNRKGLISDRGERKKAFFVVQQFYQGLKERQESGNYSPVDK